MKTADLLIGALSRALSVLAAVSVLLIMTTMATDVLSRQFTGRSIAGSYELVESMVVLVACLGLAYAERSGNNVRVRVVTSRLPDGPRRVLLVIANLVAAGVAALMAWVAWDSFGSSLERGEVRAGLIHFPLWPARLAAAVGFTAVSIELALTVWRKATRPIEELDAEIADGAV